MLAGHFGLAAIVKSRQPQLPLWSLMLSTQLLDVLFLALLPFGIESYGNLEGTQGGYGNVLLNAQYTHSLAGALGISLIAAIIAMVAWGRRNGIIIGSLVFSHWLLDLPVHRPDMPVLPGNAGNLPLFGFGLWDIPWLTAAIELILVLAGAFFYYHAAMRSAVRAERQETKAGATPRNYRQQALVTSVLMLVFLVATLAGDFMGL